MEGERIGVNTGSDWRAGTQAEARPASFRRDNQEQRPTHGRSVPMRISGRGHDRLAERLSLNFGLLSEAALSAGVCLDGPRATQDCLQALDRHEDLGDDH